MTFRFAILSAVSSKKQTEGTSLEDQITISRRVEERGWHETAGPFIVHGQTRTQYLNLRDAEDEIPAIRELLESARKGEYDVLVVYDHDRLRDLLSLVYASLSDYRVQLFSVSAQNNPVPPDEYDPYENDTNELLIGISSIKSKAEISRLRRKYRGGMRNRILIYGIPAHIPFGYRKPSGETYNRKGVPEQIPVLCQHLIHVKDNYLRGAPLTDLAAYMEREGIPPPKKGKIWYPQSIREILQNKFYAGFVEFEKSKVKKDRRLKKKSRDRNIPPEKIISNIGKHTPLWDEATWQAIVTETKRRSINYRGRQNNQFTGLLKCSECNATMWRYKNGPRSVPDRLIVRCPQNTKDHPSMTHIELMERVGKILKNSLQPHLKAREHSQLKPAVLKIDKDQLGEYQAERTRLENAYLKGLFDIENFQRRVSTLDEKIKKLKDETSNAQVKAQQQKFVREEIIRTLGSHAQHIPAWLEKNDVNETNRILHLLLESIIVHKDHVELVYHK